MLRVHCFNKPLISINLYILSTIKTCFVCGMCVCVCLAYTSEDFHMKTHRYTEDSTPSEDPKTGPRKTLAKNVKNVMFYHLRGVRAPRTSTDFQPYLIYEDIRVLGSISKASGGVCVCGGVGVCVCVCVFLFLFCFCFCFVLFCFVLFCFVFVFCLFVRLFVCLFSLWLYCTLRLATSELSYMCYHICV